MVKNSINTKLSFTSKLDCNKLILLYPDIFIDIDQTFNLLYILNEFDRGAFKKHKNFSEYYSVWYNYFLDKGLALRYFTKIPNFYKIFEVVGSSKVCNPSSGITYGYKIKDEILVNILTIGRFKTPRKYTKGDFKLIKRYKGEINLYDTAKELMEKESIKRTELNKNIRRYVNEIYQLIHTPYRVSTPKGKINSDYKHFINVDLQKCKDIVETYKKDIELKGKSNITQPDLLNIFRYIRLIEDNPNSISTFIRYKRKAGGRLFNIYEDNNIPFQSLSKEIRSNVFKGQYYYDIETSAPTILQQLSVKYFNYDMPKVRYYIQNKEYYRNLLVENVGLTYKEAKSFLTAIFFGASLNDNFFLEGSSSFSKLYGVSKIREIMEKVPLVVDLYVELREFIKKYGKYLKEKNVKKGKDGKLYLHNSRGASKEVDLNNWNNAKAILFQYFGYESQVLDCLIKKYQHSLLLFDGFISTQDINTAEMSELVKKELGFDIKFSKELL